MEKGWIRLHRQIQDCCIWQVDEPFDRRSAWIDLLLSATHRQKKMVIDSKTVIIERGSFMTSALKLSERWKWSRGKVLRYLKLLESENMVNTKRTPKGMLVTIVKYEVYQHNDLLHDTTVGTTDSTTIGTTDDTTLDTAVSTTNGTPVGTSIGTTVDTTVGTQNNNVKNIKNDKNVKNVENEKKNKERGSYEPRKKGDPYYPDDELLETAFREFLSMRIKIKKPLATKQALTRMMNKIQTLSGGDNDLAVKILNQSTDHCWTDVYDLKNDYNGRQKKTDYNKPIDWSGV